MGRKYHQMLNRILLSGSLKMQQILYAILQFSPETQSNIKLFNFINFLTILMGLILLDRYLCIASGYHVGIYSVESGERLHCLKKHKSNVIGLAINNDGFLYSCDSTGEVILWEIANGKMEKVLSPRCHFDKTGFLTTELDCRRRSCLYHA